jgi:chemotaxis protein CheD
MEVGEFMVMEMTAEKTINVGLGEIQITNDRNLILACYGLGSCIGISAFDPVAHIGAMIHVVLPVSNDEVHQAMPAKFANTGIPYMIREMEKAGAKKDKLIIKIAGGARMLPIVEEGSLLDIGFRNIGAVMEVLSNNGLNIHAKEISGNRGRSLWLHMDTGTTRVRNTSGKIVEL